MPSPSRLPGLPGIVVILCGSLLSGCYAPLKSPGIPATSLPDYYRAPIRTAAEPINMGLLSAPSPPHYVLGPGDILDVTIPDLYQTPDLRQSPQERPIRLQVLDDGAIHVPRLGAVPVKGLTVGQTRARLDQMLHGKGHLVNPTSSIVLVEKATVRVVVLGEVNHPGVFELPQFENDVAHALAAAGGFNEEAGDLVEIHRHSVMGFGTPLAVDAPPLPKQIAHVGHSTPSPYNSYRGDPGIQPASYVQSQPQPPLSVGNSSAGGIVKIPLRSMTPGLARTEDMRLYPGDVVVVRPRRHEVFYVVGKLSENQRARFTLGDREREIGNGFLLPPDREIDVITAVAMAGYIDPIDSPTTVTVHRMGVGVQPPMLIRVDLLKARQNPRENVLVQPGDIIYLNPDCAWWMRRTFDRFIDNVLGVAVGRAITN